MTNLAKLKEIENEIETLTDQESKIRIRVQALRSEHMALVSRLIEESQKRTILAAKEILAEPPGANRAEKARGKIFDLILDILEGQENGLSLGQIVERMAGVTGPNSSDIIEDIKNILGQMSRVNLIQIKSNDGLHFRYYKAQGHRPSAEAAASPQTDNPKPAPQTERTSIGQVLATISRIFRSGTYRVKPDDLFPALILPSHRTVILGSLVGQGFLRPDPSNQTYTILKDPHPVPSEDPPSAADVKSISDRLSELRQKASDLYRKGARIVSRSELAEPLASGVVFNVLIGQGILDFNPHTGKYEILKDPLAESAITPGEVKQAYLNGISKMYRLGKTTIYKGEDIAAFHPSGSAKYPLVLHEILGDLIQNGSLLALGSEYRILKDPLAPEVATASPSGPAVASKTGRLNPSSHGDYPPGVQSHTRDLLDNLRKDATKTYAVDDVVSWLQSRGVSSRDIRTLASHNLASLVDFGCLTRVSPGKYRVCNYRGYFTPSH